jgi:hypothetical protein
VNRNIPRANLSRTAARARKLTPQPNANISNYSRNLIKNRNSSVVPRHRGKTYDKNRTFGSQTISSTTGATQARALNSPTRRLEFTHGRDALRKSNIKTSYSPKRHLGEEGKLSTLNQPRNSSPVSSRNIESTYKSRYARG